LKILDFGLAKLQFSMTPDAVTETMSETGTVAGTLPYMAPEQLLGAEVDARTDMHAAGSVLYEMATGKGPFAEVVGSQLIGTILHRAPRPLTSVNPKLSPELARIIGKCLEKEPEDRYQSAKELASDLRRLQTGDKTAVHSTTGSAKRFRPAKICSIAVLPLANLFGDPKRNILQTA